MINNVLSIFVDESGDFGKIDKKSPYYYVTLVFHEQNIDISDSVDILDTTIRFFRYTTLNRQWRV